jgi:hypothetical protein
MQEQLKIASFWSQLGTDNGEDDNNDKDNYDNDVMEEMPMDKWRDYSRLPGQRRGCKHGNQFGPSRADSPPCLPTTGWGGDDGNQDAENRKSACYANGDAAVDSIGGRGDRWGGDQQTAAWRQCLV